MLLTHPVWTGPLTLSQFPFLTTSGAVSMLPNDNASRKSNISKYWPLNCWSFKVCRYNVNVNEDFIKINIFWTDAIICLLELISFSTISAHCTMCVHIFELNSFGEGSGRRIRDCAKRADSTEDLNPGLHSDENQEAQLKISHSKSKLSG